MMNTKRNGGKKINKNNHGEEKNARTHARTHIDGEIWMISISFICGAKIKMFIEHLNLYTAQHS